MSQTVRTDSGALLEVQAREGDWLLVRSVRLHAYAFAKITGRTPQRMPGGGLGIRVALYEAVDTGECGSIRDVLRPGNASVGGGFLVV
jgi:hypothetical protein